MTIRRRLALGTVALCHRASRTLKLKRSSGRRSEPPRVQWRLGSLVSRVVDAVI